MEFAGMVDLARSPKEISEERAGMKSALTPDIAVPAYPYGLCISLDEETLEKLGLDGDLPDVGEMVHLVCMAKVTSARQDESVAADGSKKISRRVELQITHMAAEDEDREDTLEEREGRDKAKSEAFYGDGDD